MSGLNRDDSGIFMKGLLGFITRSRDHGLRDSYMRVSEKTGPEYRAHAVRQLLNDTLDVQGYVGQRLCYRNSYRV